MPGRVVSLGRALRDLAPLRDARVMQGYLAASRYAEAQEVRIVERVLGLEGAIREAFGKEALKGQPMGELAAKYIGPEVAGKASEKYIGTVWHFLDNPKLYEGITPLQARVAQEWDTITRAELNFSQQVGVPIGEIQDAWIAHSFKRPEEAFRVLAGPTALRGKPAVMRGRKLTTEQWLDLAQLLNQEVETDVVKILARRLGATARARTNIVLLDNLAEQMGGQRAGKTLVGFDTLTANGLRWQFPREIAQQIRSLLQPSLEAPSSRMVAEVIDIARGTLLNLDLSVGVGRQGFMAASANPMATMRAWGTATQILLSPTGWAEWYASHATQMRFWAQHGLKYNIATTDISFSLAMAKAGQKPLLDRVPIMGWMNNAQFNVLMTVLKTNLAEARLKTLMEIKNTPGLTTRLVDKLLDLPWVKELKNWKELPLDELANGVGLNVNNQVGGIEWARLGRSPGLISKVMLLTEGYTRSRIGNIVNAFEAGPTGVLARKMWFRHLGVATLLATGLSLISSGKLPEYNPAKTKFLDVRSIFGYITLLPDKVYIRTIARLLAGKPKKEYGEEGLLKERFQALWNLWEGRIGQFPRMTMELSLGRDYYGRPIDNKAYYIAQNMAPIIAGNLMEDLRLASGKVVTAGRTAIGFLGFGIRPLPLSERISEISQKTLGKSWDELEPAERAQIEMLPEVRELRERERGGTEAQQRRSMLLAEVDNQLAKDIALDRGKLPSGQAYGPQDWIRDYYAGQSRMATIRRTVDELFKQVMTEPENENERNLKG